MTRKQVSSRGILDSLLRFAAERPLPQSQAQSMCDRDINSTPLRRPARLDRDNLPSRRSPLLTLSCPIFRITQFRANLRNYEGATCNEQSGICGYLQRKLRNRDRETELGPAMCSEGHPVCLMTIRRSAHLTKQTYRGNRVTPLPH
jgi:hypothetical protein